MNLHSLAKWVIAILAPFTLIMLGVRMMLTPLYLRLEYELPGFPADEYGFTTAERLHWGAYGVNYLLNGAPPSFLGDLRLENGQPVFTEREVGHMRDVKIVVAGLFRAWYGVIAIQAILALWAWRSRWLMTYRAGWRLGAVVTLGLAGISAVLGTLGASGSGDLFWEFFSGFHHMFFSGDLWLFAFSDTLIRLYPMRFWQDSVVYIGMLSAIGAVALLVGLRENWRGRSASR